MADAAKNRPPRPTVIGHENVPHRFERYDFTSGYNRVINERQFGQFNRRGYSMVEEDDSFLPSGAARPDRTYTDHLNLTLGGVDVELKHARGETDDHRWAWIPERKAICAGDFFIWCFPNAGNPKKVQRYPVEWAAAKRAMAAQSAEMFLPAHGLPIEGCDRIRGVLSEVAEALEFLVKETFDRMNAGMHLTDIV